MDRRIAHMAEELVKLAEEGGSKPGILGSVAATLPFAAATAAADVPRGAVDKYVEQTVRGIARAKRSSSLMRGIGRGAGRLGAGIGTSPVFVSGIEDLRSGDESRKKKGYAKIVGSGLVFSALKGGGEAALENLGKNPAAILRAVRSTAGARSIVGAGAAALTAGAVAKATSTKSRAKGGKPKGVYKTYAAPALAGAAIGAGKGAFDEVWGVGSKATLRGISAKAGGRAAAGLIGAAVLTGAVKTLLPSKKDPSVRRWQKSKTAGENDMDLYSSVRGWAEDMSADRVAVEYHASMTSGIGERTPSRRAATYALRDDLESRGIKPSIEPKERWKVTPRMRAENAAASAAIMGAAVAPTVAAAAMWSLPPTDRDRLLSEALDEMIIKRSLGREDTPDVPVLRHALSAYEAYPTGPLGLGEHEGKTLRLAPRGTELPGIVAHEMGHATTSGPRNLLMHPLANRIARLGSIMSVSLPVLAVAGMGSKSFATKEDLESKAKLIAASGVAAALMQAPTALEETIANAKGIGILREAGATIPEAIGKALLHAGPGYATYLAAPALPFLVAGALKAKSVFARGRDDSDDDHDDDD